jgi:GNAT superfamily N-acetyltransferase
MSGERLVTTYLELDDVAALRPARPAEAAVELVDPPNGLLNRRMYVTVGAPWRWTDHLGKDDAWWHDHARRCETWVVREGTAPLGYAELGRPGPEGVELQYFGLVPEAQGRGLGGHLLTAVLRRGLALAPRVWVSTCSWDGPHAQANYEARGMRPFRRVVG